MTAGTNIMKYPWRSLY